MSSNEQIPIGLRTPVKLHDKHLQETVDSLLCDALESGDERRASKREPFFAPLQLALPYNGARWFTCFSRDISPTGIGLLLFMAVEPGEVLLKIPSKSQGHVHIRCEIIWCRPCGDGWHLAGARFIEVQG
jgi:hypothetical protein